MLPILYVTNLVRKALLKWDQSVKPTHSRDKGYHNLTVILLSWRGHVDCPHWTPSFLALLKQGRPTPSPMHSFRTDKRQVRNILACYGWLHRCVDTRSNLETIHALIILSEPSVNTTDSWEKWGGRDCECLAGGWGTDSFDHHIV